MNCSQTSFYKVFVLLMLSNAVASRNFYAPQVQDTQTSMKKLACANNDFALNFHRRLAAASGEENLIFSPLTLSLAFGMLLFGARGDTATELRNVLGYQRADLSDESIHLGFHRFLTDVVSRSSTKGYTMNVANGILVDKQLKLLLNYKNAMENLYRAPVQNVNFAEMASKVKDSINSWVNSLTNGKIEHLLDEISPYTAMIILNAVYFKGLWKIPFDSLETSSETFYNNGQESQATKVEMMQMTEETFPFISTENYQALELPYKGNISMIIFLPTEKNGLPALEASMTLEQFDSIRKSMRPTQVTIALPKFRIEYAKSLNQELQALGMNRIFQYQIADFSGISPVMGLEVSEVVHKAFVSVDEIGTEAAGATSLSITPYSGRYAENWFNAEHPFLFAIFDKTSELILFLGRVNSL